MINISSWRNINPVEGKNAIKSEDDIKANDPTDGENARKSVNTSQSNDTIENVRDAKGDDPG
jgi:hypothetical protein